MSSRGEPRAWLGTIVAAACTASRPPATAPQCRDAAAIVTNDMPNNDMPNNGLTVQALTKNQALVTALAGAPLTAAVFTGDALASPYAADLVKYVVSCALDPCDEVELPTRTVEQRTLAASFGGAFRGELGLCGDRYNQLAAAREPRWRDAAPSAGCLERVSACVLARTNALGQRVVLSIRGDGTALSAQVPVQPAFREHHGTPIVSFAPCGGPPGAGAPGDRNCGWAPRFVGECVAGSRVQLAATTPAEVRICAGIYGCDHDAPGAGPTTLPASDTPWYGGTWLATSPTPADAVAFTCPANGPILDASRRAGYYAVMVAAPAGLSSVPMTTDVRRVGPVAPDHDQYPAPEREVFTYREGAFYGNLFAVASPQFPSNTMLWGDQFACYGDRWDKGNALLAARLCAGTGSDRDGAGTPCFANPPRACDGPTPACTTTDLVATSCVGIRADADAARRWGHPYTTYLNHPCDLFTDRRVCATALGASVLPLLQSSVR